MVTAGKSSRAGIAELNFISILFNFMSSDITHLSRQKLNTYPLFDNLPGKYLSYLQIFATQGTLNALQWGPFPENINLGKIGNILKLQSGYYG